MHFFVSDPSTTLGMTGSHGRDDKESPSEQHWPRMTGSPSQETMESGQVNKRLKVRIDSLPL